MRERTGIPRQVLANRLAMLVERGVLRREPYREPGRPAAPRVPAHPDGPRPLAGAGRGPRLGRPLPGRPRGLAAVHRPPWLRGRGGRRPALRRRARDRRRRATCCPAPARAPDAATESRPSPGYRALDERRRPARARAVAARPRVGVGAAAHRGVPGAVAGPAGQQRRHLDADRRRAVAAGRRAHAATLVALVQTASMLPIAVAGAAVRGAGRHVRPAAAAARRAGCACSSSAWRWPR